MKIKVNPDDFRAKPGEKSDLGKMATKVNDYYDDGADYKELLEEYKVEICELQEILFAHNKYSVLVIFQGMDACGKDGAVKHVMSGINPAGVVVHSFKRPNEEELDHDFLWRVNTRLPERGRIGIFNRSYYEEVLVVRVHPEILTEVQHIPKEFVENQDKVWKHRYEDISNYEKYLHRNGTLVLKFFLNISKDEQRKRLMERIDQPDKNWKMEIGDLTERAKWNEYMAAFEECIRETATDDSPWYLIPADGKKNARLIICAILLEEIKKLHVEYPQLAPEQKEKLKVIRDLLEKD